MRFLAASLVLSIFLLPLAQAGDEGVAGNWKVTILEEGNQVSFWLIHLESKGGKLTGTADPLGKVPPTQLGEAKIAGDLLQFTLRLKNGPVFSFEGKLPKAGGKKIFGSLARTGQMIPTILEATAAKTPFELDREILSRTPNDPRVFHAVLGLIERAKQEKATVKDVQEWAETALRAAVNFGPRWQLDMSMKLIEALLAEDGYAAAAVDTARQAEKMLEANSPMDARLRVLTALGTALKQAGQADQAKEVETRIDKLENQAFAAYSAKALDFKVEKFAGRKGKSNRAVLVELFTGAQCPPCVGADLGFDALHKGYEHKEVVLLQYHLHVPGPDALTNDDTEAREAYYGDGKVRGTPTIIFNGKVAPVGGGGREDGKDIFKEYRKVVDPQLETPAAAQLQASAVRKGDKVQIKATVQDLEKPGDKVKLRIALVEDWVRYKGRNGLSYHHRVVRAFPGGAAGQALTKKEDEKIVEVDLQELRKNLNKYLNAAAKEQPFLDGQRPMRFRDLSVVAFIQNDATQEILQAVDVTVKEE